VNLVQAHAKNLKKENDRLREIIGEKHPVPMSECVPAVQSERGSAVDAVHVNALRAWLADLHSGRYGLGLAEPDVRTSRQTRPGTLIVPVGVIETIQAVCGAPGALAAPSPGPTFPATAEASAE
jgi:hypothetical protein